MTGFQTNHHDIHRQVNNIALVQAYFIQQPAQTEQYRRTMTASFNDNIHNAIQNDAAKAAHTGGFNAASYSNSASDLIRVSAPGQQITIPNGWGETRFGFFIEFETNRNGRRFREIISGFTDYCDTVNGRNGVLLDEKMSLWVNNYISRDLGTFANLHNDQVLLPDLTQQQDFNCTPVGMRPKDTQASLSLSDLASMCPESLSNRADARSLMDAGGLLSSRGNSIGSRYLARTLKAYSGAAADFDSEGAWGAQSEIFGRAAEALDEHSMEEISFFRAMDQECNYSQTGFIPMSVIMANWPDRNDGRYHIHQLPAFIPANTTESWSNNLDETAIAYNISQGVPAVMSQYMMAQLSYSCMSVAGQITITPMPMVGHNHQELAGLQPMFEGLDTPPTIAAIENAIVQEVLSVMAHRYGDFMINIRANFFGNIDIEVTLYGNEAPITVPYSAPVFCDNLTNVLTADNFETLDRFATNIGSALQSANEVLAAPTQMGSANSATNFF